MEAGLPLAGAAAPAPVVIDGPHPIEVRPDVGMSGKELVETTGRLLPGVPQALAAQAPPRRGPVSALRADVLLDLLCRCPGSGLGGGASHVRQGGLVDQFPGGGIVVARGREVRRRLGVPISQLVPLDPDMGGDPADCDLVSAGEDAVADLDGRNCETLA